MGRLSAGFYLLMIALVLYYERGWADAPLTPRLIAKLLSFALGAVVLFVVYGAIRGAQAFVSGTLSEISSLILRSIPKRASCRWSGIIGLISKGCPGIAGAFTQSLSDPNSVHHDLGASWLLTGAIQSIPGFLKPYASDVTDLSNDLDWYPYSIVPTGVESFFMSFGWSAILMYPLAQYLVAWRFPLWFLSLRLPPAAKAVGYIIMGWSVIFMRGPLTTWVAFCISYPLIILLFWPFFSRHFKRRDLHIQMKPRIGGNKLLSVETAKGH